MSPTMGRARLTVALEQFRPHIRKPLAVNKAQAPDFQVAGVCSDAGDSSAGMELGVDS